MVSLNIENCPDKIGRLLNIHLSAFPKKYSIIFRFYRDNSQRRKIIAAAARPQAQVSLPRKQVLRFPFSHHLLLQKHVHPHIQ